MMFSLLGTLHQTHIWSDTCSELSTSVLLTSFDAVYSLIVFLKELYMKELPFKSLRLLQRFNVFQRSLLCSPRLHLFDQKHSQNRNIVTFYNNFK